MNPISIAEAYYKAMGEKNIEEVKKHLHPSVQFIGPLAKVDGKEAFLEAVKNLFTFMNKLTIRAKFGSGDQAMIVYDLDFPTPIGNVPTAALLTFQKDLIIKIELFFDGHPFKS